MPAQKSGKWVNGLLVAINVVINPIRPKSWKPLPEKAAFGSLNKPRKNHKNDCCLPVQCFSSVLVRASRATEVH